MVLALGCISGAEADEISLKHLTPSKLIAMLAGFEAKDFFRQGTPRLGHFTAISGGLIPDGVKLTAQDSKGILVVDGTPEQIAEVTRYVQLFDVKPMQLELQMEIECPTRNYVWKSTTTLSNNRRWKTSDDVLDTEFHIAPRVNDDGTITTFLRLSQGDEVRQSVFRSKEGVPVYLTSSDDLRFSVEKEIFLDKASAEKSQGPDLDVPPFRIKLTFKILPTEAKNSKFGRQNAFPEN